MPRISPAHILARRILPDMSNVDISRQAIFQHIGCTLPLKLKQYKPKLNENCFDGKNKNLNTPQIELRRKI